MTLVRSSIPERDLGGVGLGCAAGAAVVLVLVLLCSWGWVVHYYSFLAAHAVHLCAVRWGVFLLLYRNSPARMFFRILLTRGAGSSSACSATSPRRSSASSGGALVLGLLGAARWCRLLTQRRVRQCSGGGLGARARHAPRFSLAANIGRGRLGFVVLGVVTSKVAEAEAGGWRPRRPHMRDIEIGEELFAPHTEARGSWSACSARRSSHHTQG